MLIPPSVLLAVQQQDANTRKGTPMQPVIDALQEIVNDLDQHDMTPVNRLSASLLLCSLIYLLQTREDAQSAQRKQAASEVQ